uniref:Uncharacterized protein n=1 Tax=Spongospora subterranea TaxID=70186 RepID=A0A0H5REJ3_9EUKA|eukprot:CRZ12433.1 hypothetical protein [Spongospora subterranea]
MLCPGSMMLNMMNVSDAGNASDTYHGRGLMMISGLASYQRLSIYLRQLGINYDVVSDPDIVSSNLVISYLSVFMTMEQTNCMQSISSGQFGSCIARIPRHDKLCQSGSAQDRLVAAVEASSRILGQPISPSLLRTSLCNGTSTEDDDDVSNAPATSVSIIAILSLAAVSLLL